MHTHDLVMPTEPGGRVICTGCDETFSCPHPERVRTIIYESNKYVARGPYLVCACGDHQPVECEHRHLERQLGPTQQCLECHADVPVKAPPIVRDFIGSGR